MNPSDSKKLEEIKKRYMDMNQEYAVDCEEDMMWLISKLTEQDREIERLRTVAAEARKEGWEEGIEELWGVLIKRMREERKPLEDWQVNEEAERLKEQGK